MDCPIKECVKENNTVFTIFFLRQLFSCSTVIINFFMFGIYMGSTTVIVPQLRKEANSTDAVTPEMASWMASISPYSALPWVFLLPIITHRFGIKTGLILISVNVLIGNTIFYCSTSAIELIISQAMQGILIGSVFNITIVVLSENTSPKYRGFMLSIKVATLYWGIWVSNAIGTFYHWKNIGIVVFIFGFYNLIASIFGCESPYWLATKGRFDECTTVHRWLKGTDENSEEELKKLILSQQEKSNITSEINGRIKAKRFKKLLNALKLKSFYKSLLYACMPLFLYYATGKLACAVYAIEIIKKITSSERMAYKGMLILDGVTVLGMFLGSALSKILTRRKQLLIFSCAGICFLYGLTFYLYIIKLDIVTENNYICLVFLMGFSICVGCGPVILAPCCAAELVPLRNRSLFLCFLSFLNNLFFGASLKIAPLVFRLCGTSGAFLFYAVSSSVAFIILMKYMPETKDRTIQEIEEYVTKDVPYVRGTVIAETIPLKVS